MLGRRAHDWSSKGFQNFPFMSVHFWDENPYGEWVLNVDSTGPSEKGLFNTWWFFTCNVMCLTYESCESLNLSFTGQAMINGKRQNVVLMIERIVTWMERRKLPKTISKWQGGALGFLALAGWPGPLIKLSQNWTQRQALGSVEPTIAKNVINNVSGESTAPFLSLCTLLLLIHA